MLVSIRRPEGTHAPRGRHVLRFQCAERRCRGLAKWRRAPLKAQKALERVRTMRCAHCRPVTRVPPPGRRAFYFCLMLVLFEHVLFVSVVMGAERASIV